MRHLRGELMKHKGLYIYIFGDVSAKLSTSVENRVLTPKLCRFPELQHDLKFLIIKYFNMLMPHSQNLINSQKASERHIICEGE